MRPVAPCTMMPIVRMAIWMRSYAILDETFRLWGLDLMIRKATRTDYPRISEIRLAVRENCLSKFAVTKCRLIKWHGGRTIVSENRRRRRFLQNEFAGEEKE
jgi:hypothetical protein